MADTGLGQSWRLSPSELPVLEAGNTEPAALRRFLSSGHEKIREAFFSGVPVSRLIRARSRLVDQLLFHIWVATIAHTHAEWSLIAVGGYGRGELHPHSDIDLLLLLDAPPDEQAQDTIERLVALLWDVGLHVSHSVRTLDECEHLAATDITIATNLMEARLIAGSPLRFDELRHRVGPDKIWPGDSFFEAKTAEQKERHHRYQGSSNALEPNIKESPGGLRDLHVIGWVCKRHFQVDSLDSLVALNFLLPEELKSLKSCMHFLWEVRFALHIAAGRKEERLLFDWQPTIAEWLGFKPQPGAPKEHIEQFMKRYYRTVLRIRELNDMLLQLFEEAILQRTEQLDVEALDEAFERRGEHIAVRAPDVFHKEPRNILRLFVHMARDSRLRKIEARTLRQLRSSLQDVDESFRTDPLNQESFLTILGHHQGIRRAFVYMKRYGVLKRYLPAYGEVVGQMQFDLFHIYTVDEHTLFVMKNLAALADETEDADLPLARDIVRSLERPELLYLAALFHDLGKGRGGDHSELGAEMAYQFCTQHNLPTEDAQLISWLVRHHLVMSLTAQRKDIEDPDVIAAFAAQVQDIRRLQLLYALTVADVRATNPTLWNSWKDALLRSLYDKTLQWLERPESRLHAGKPYHSVVRQEALDLVRQSQGDETRFRQWLELAGEDYPRKFTAEQIHWQFRALSNASEKAVRVRRHPSDGASEILVYCTDRKGLFADLCQMLFDEQLTIVNADIHTTPDGRAIDCFTVLELDGGPIRSSRRNQLIADAIMPVLSADFRPTRTRLHIPARYKHFHRQSEVRFLDSVNGHWNELEIVTLDRPGLLAVIARLLVQLEVRVHGARIATFGERAEDWFVVSKRDNTPFASSEEKERIAVTIAQNLDESIRT